LIEQKTLNTWSPAIALYEVVFLGIESVAFVTLTILIDVLSAKPSTAILWKKLTCQWRFMDKTVAATNIHSVKDDDDVIVENERVRSGKANEDLVVLNALSKQYPNGKQAVDFMSLGIPAGQCFGLLGINGAGKTPAARRNPGWFQC
jgi:ABC-type transport system involved in cytochrome bd biosynthesis fused ATPase/permease subunit